MGDGDGPMAPPRSFMEAFSSAASAPSAAPSVPGSFLRAAKAQQHNRQQTSTVLPDELDGGVPAASTAGASCGFHVPVNNAGHNASASAAPGSAPHTCVLVHPRQRGNPLLAHVRHVRWRFADPDAGETPLADYEVGERAYVAFISMRYHLLHPEYAMRRLEQMPRAHRGMSGARLRVLVCHVDVDDEAEPLRELGLVAARGGATLLCGWSHAECARYIEALKAFDGKPVDAVAGKLERDYLSRLVHAFYSIRGVNRTDAASLVGRLGSLASVLMAPKVRLEGVPGIGALKATRLYDAFRTPFFGGKKKSSAAPAATMAAAAATVDDVDDADDADEFTM